VTTGQSARSATITIGRWQVERRLLAFIGLALLARLAFWLITDRVWEDALITVTHARNAVAGIVLTHHPGEPVTHGFTSAVSVLIPLLGEAIVHGSGIFVLRVASLLAAVATIVFADRICRRLGFGRWPTLLVLVYLAVDQNQIFYGMAGMETQVAVAVLLWSVDAVMAGTVVRTGVSFGLGVLTRPDFLLWTAAASLDPQTAPILSGATTSTARSWISAPCRGMPASIRNSGCWPRLMATGQASPRSQ